jgi:hypothetical protein
MNCDFITKGKKVGCFEAQGGVKDVYFALFSDYGMSVANQVLTDLGSLATTYKYELEGNVHGLTETPTVSKDNGTFFVTQVMTATFPILGAELQNELNLLMRNRLLVFVADYNGNIKLAGISNGARATNGSAVTGLASADLNGYTIEISAEEKDFAPFLDDSSKTALIATVANSYIGESPSV